MITLAMRAILRRWATDDDAPPEVYLNKRDALALLAALDAANALRDETAQIANDCRDVAANTESTPGERRAWRAVEGIARASVRR